MSGAAPCMFLKAPAAVKDGDPLYGIMIAGRRLVQVFVVALCKHARILNFYGADYGCVPDVPAFDRFVRLWVDACYTPHGTTPTLRALHDAAHAAMAAVEHKIHADNKPLVRDFIRRVAETGGIQCAACAPPAPAAWTPTEISNMYGTAATAFLHRLAALPLNDWPAAIAKFVAETPAPK